MQISCIFKASDINTSKYSATPSYDHTFDTTTLSDHFLYPDELFPCINLYGSIRRVIGIPRRRSQKPKFLQENMNQNWNFHWGLGGGGGAGVQT